jgi:hypothetical protein
VGPIFDDGSLTPAEKIAQLVNARNSGPVVAHLEYILSLIQNENVQTDDEDTASFLKTMAADARPIPDRVADVLVEALKKRGYENAFKWFWSTGGLQTDVGILTGTKGVKSSWTYAPSDTLLASLLSVAFARPGGGPAQAELTIEAVLAQFERRFGLLVNRPPAALATAENRAAAAKNFETFKYRLQLLGVFDGLSDDLGAQRVRNPLVNLLEGV